MELHFLSSDVHPFQFLRLRIRITILRQRLESVFTPIAEVARGTVTFVPPRTILDIFLASQLHGQ